MTCLQLLASRGGAGARSLVYTCTPRYLIRRRLPLLRPRLLQQHMPTNQPHVPAQRSFTAAESLLSKRRGVRIALCNVHMASQHVSRLGTGQHTHRTEAQPIHFPAQ